MTRPGVLAACVLCAWLAACKDPPPPATTVTRAADSSVLGNTGEPGTGTSPAPAIPPPPLPAGIEAQLVPVGNNAALAIWTQQGAVHAAGYEAGLGWAPAQALEQIHGQASDPQLASDGQGRAIAIWQHRIGKIRSLRFSRYETGTGWSVPDVLPGALPREASDSDSPQLRMDSAGRAYASWPSGFDRNEMQTARFVPGQGWSRAVSQPLPSPAQAAASAPAAATN